jgi:hypothetical protein
MMLVTHFKTFQLLIITGNPFATETESYKKLEDSLFTQLSAVVINKNPESVH